MARILKHALKGLLKEEEISLIYGGFDIVGDIAILKIPEQLIEKKKIIADALLKQVKPLRTILLQSTPVSGDYRLRNLECIGGENKTITRYREYGCVFNVDLATAYFSPRLSTERYRIAELVQPGETVINLFAGVAAFSIIIAKKVPTALTYSIDINPEAHNQALNNIKLNKVTDKVIPILGDAREAITHLKGKADRVLMPLPEMAGEYLDTAIEALKPPVGIIHYYSHNYAVRRQDAVNESIKDIKSLMKNQYSIISSRIVREVGPRWYQVVLDLKVTL